MSDPVWACALTVPCTLMEDAPALEAHLARSANDALLEAASAGVTINGEPNVTTQALVWVEDWGPEGGALVAVEAARLVGIEDEPTAVAVRMQWQA